MAHPHAVPVAMWSPVGEALASRAPGGDLRGSLITGVGPAPMPQSWGGDLQAGSRGLWSRAVGETVPTQGQFAGRSEGKAGVHETL